MSMVKYKLLWVLLGFIIYLLEKIEKGAKMNGQNRSDIKIGAKVKIVLKADQKTGKLTEGIVEKILTNSSFHPHGIKVMLTDRQVGRVQEII